jgi:MFS family permease
MGFLEKEPPRWECWSAADQAWYECKKKAICEGNLPQDQYRPVTSDEQYLDNWVTQFDLLCEPKWRIGIIGSIYFTGVLCLVIPLTWLSDQYGRRYSVWVSHLSLACVLLLLCTLRDIEAAYVLLFIGGASFGGRVIVANGQILEFNVNASKPMIIQTRLLSVSVTVILITLIYQFGTRSTSAVFLIFVIISGVGIVYYAFLIPESPQWHHDRKEYPEARAGLN